MEIDKTDSHIFTVTTTTTRMNISLETGKLRDTHSEGKVKVPASKPNDLVARVGIRHAKQASFAIDMCM
jgi:hypothetical protein